MKIPTLICLFCILIVITIIETPSHLAFATTYQVTITQGSGASQSCVTTATCYDPSNLQIAVGDTVTWTNQDSVGHTVTSGQPTDNQTGTIFDSSLIASGNSFSLTFSQAGTYNYFDMVDPYMTGEVIVGKSSSSQTPQPQSTESSQTQTSITNYYVEVDPLPDFAPSYAGNLIYDATNSWTDANPNIKFWKADSSHPADLYIQWIKDYGTSPMGETISGHTIQIGLGDSNCGGKWEPYSSATLHHIALHELGHFLLGPQHSSDPNNIMYPTFTPDYGTVEFDKNLAPMYFWFIPICSTKAVAAYDYSVSIDDPTYGVDIYFVPSQTEYENARSGNSFQYYSGDGCYAENYLSYVNTCDGVQAGSGLLIMTDKRVTNGLTKVTVNLTERASSTGTLQNTASKVHQYRFLSEQEQTQQEANQAITQAQQQANQAIIQAQTQSEQEKTQANARVTEANSVALAAQESANQLKTEEAAMKAKAQLDAEKAKIDAENKLKEMQLAYDKKSFYRINLDSLKDSLKNAEIMLSGLNFESSDAQKKVQQAWEERGMAMSDIAKAEANWEDGNQALNQTNSSLAISYYEGIDANAISAGNHLKTIANLTDDAQKIDADYKKHRFCFLFWCFNV